jgi:tetratricopeptide (TPR) repeat protein
MAKNTKLYTKASNAIAAGQYVKAIGILQKLLEEEPANSDFLLLMGEGLMRNEQFSEALAYFAKVVETENTNIRALVNFGVALLRNRHLEEAKDILLYALELEPKSIDAHINLGSVYQSLMQPEKSLQNAFKVIELDPGSFLAYNNLGCALGDVHQLDAAREAYITSNLLNPNYLTAIINLAQLEVKCGNHERGLELYESALNVKNISPGEKDVVKYYLSHSYLYFGQLEKGWDCYEFGFADLLPTGAYRSSRKFKHPRWDGDLNENRKILIWREQGLGDEILFSTCLQDMHETNLDIILECDPRLIGIYQRMYPRFKIRGESINVNNYPSMDDFELHVPIGSLPKYFRRNLADFNKPIPKFTPLETSVNFINQKLQKHSDKILVGICWRSGKLSIERNLNYTALSDWGPLLSDPQYKFVNLFHGDCENEIQAVEKQFNIEILRWQEIDLKNDLETVLALVSKLDCVVSVATAVSVIAAAAGVKTLVLFQRSWVLLGQNDRYPWFSTARPFVVETNEHVGINISNLHPHIKKLPRN